MGGTNDRFPFLEMMKDRSCLTTMAILFAYLFSLFSFPFLGRRRTIWNSASFFSTRSFATSSPSKVNSMHPSCFYLCRAVCLFVSVLVCWDDLFVGIGRSEPGGGGRKGGSYPPAVTDSTAFDVIGGGGGGGGKGGISVDIGRLGGGSGRSGLVGDWEEKNRHTQARGSAPRHRHRRCRHRRRHRRQT